MSIRLLLGILLVGAAFSACMQHTAYRTITSLQSLHISKDPRLEDPHSIQHRSYTARFGGAAKDEPDDEGDYYLSFVEFDDQGWFVERQQMDALLELLADLEERQPERQVLIQVYAHGWKHNASGGDDNVVCFSRFLERNDLIERKLLDDQHNRTVVGVYVGWRGLPYEAGQLSNFSFWNRKDTAARVGQGGVFELLTRLSDYRTRRRQQEVARVKKERIEEIAELQRSLNETTDQQEKDKHSSRLYGKLASLDEAPANPYQTQLMITGHSFGGLVIYSALSHALMERAAKARYAPTTDDPADASPEVALPEVEGFGDFVMLVNPAFEGSLYEPLHRIAQESRFAPGQKPVMMIVTSKDDAATGLAFPLGQRLGSLLQHSRDADEMGAEGRESNQSDSLHSAIGHDEQYRTHDLEYVDRGVQLWDGVSRVRLWLADDQSDSYWQAHSDGGLFVSTEDLENLRRDLDELWRENAEIGEGDPAGDSAATADTSPVEGWIVIETDDEVEKRLAISEGSSDGVRKAFARMKEAVLDAFPKEDERDDCDCPHLEATKSWSQVSLHNLWATFVDASTSQQLTGASFGENVGLEPYRDENDKVHYERGYPFLVVSTEDPIIADHNSIYSNDFINFAQAFFYLCVVAPGQLPAEPSKPVASE